MLRREQGKTYFTAPTKESLFREAFGLPGDEAPLSEAHCMLTLTGKSEVFSGKLYLSASFLAFASLDRRSCRLSLPLATVRRVEKLVPGTEGTSAGSFALSLTLANGLRIILQLNSLRPTNDAFCAVLRTRLKASLPMMKALKPFSKTFFSEWFLAPERDEDLTAAGGEKPIEKIEVGDLISLDEKIDEKGKGKEDESNEWTTGSGVESGFHAGLGMMFKFPGDSKKLREKSKMKLWKEYLRQHGRNLTLIRYPAFNRLVQVGLPNRLRGEIWELTCGSMFLRLHNPGVYAQILSDNAGRTSASTEDIEKDLHRSLPEYAAYQDAKGIDTMRRVLTAYSWSNPAVGYCQAMNLVVASFLIYMSEEQCFWCLSVLCDRLLPGYYSPSMYGTVLDQRVFEHLVERCLPLIHDHFATVDVQLSVASLPWFLSCYIASMPMIFAFRIIDCFFLMGPKVLFQVGLAILKINGEELLATTDDGAFINVIKSYFTTLGDSAHPNSNDPRVRQITRFQELLVVAFREFNIITDDTISTERKRFQAEVVVNIENFAKRSACRNLDRTGRLDKNQLGLIYDHFQLALLKERELLLNRSRTPSVGSIKPVTSSTPPKEEDKIEVRMNRKTFRIFLAGIASWARDEKSVRNGFHEHVEREPVDHELIDRIFLSWDSSKVGALSFQDVVTGLDSVLYNDLMSNLAWLFTIHDNDNDGYLTKDEVLQLSESLLFIFRNEPGDRYLGSVSNLMQNLFEYAETTADVPSSSTTAEGEGEGEGEGRSRAGSIVSDNPHRPYLALAVYRMVVLSDPLMEEFFEADLTNSWKLEVLIQEEKAKPTSAKSWFGEIVNAVMTDENKERINRLADEVGKRLEIQTQEIQSSLQKDKTFGSIEPVARDSLFSTSNRKVQPSTTSTLTQSSSTPSTRTQIPSATTTTSTTKKLPTFPPSENPWVSFDVQAAAAKAMERPQFVIDDAGDGEDEEDDEGSESAGGAHGDQLLDEVDSFLSQADESDGRAVQESSESGKSLF